MLQLLVSSFLFFFLSLFVFKWFVTDCLFGFVLCVLEENHSMWANELNRNAKDSTIWFSKSTIGNRIDKFSISESMDSIMCPFLAHKYKCIATKSSIHWWPLWESSWSTLDLFIVSIKRYIFSTLYVLFFAFFVSSLFIVGSDILRAADTWYYSPSDNYSFYLFRFIVFCVCMCGLFCFSFLSFFSLHFDYVWVYYVIASQFCHIEWMVANQFTNC